ncbi:nucleotide sugar dehydrogenase [Allorhodopirellula solitaria]|uniref:UDP-N-acetyl-D-glucosamine 6-dehydrogenase n=1 Tax=Allorhodopirellula solitaria TaxID=2527987 RepID=A0A5C5WMT3_9BACT|nr:nucleotide sugar dehydrogenase [Allorhodopirellula solitaria]TWT52124.1 UDP-N-acetyl-D-glucosamine 6-dehydrogenase [Allorhodopirellula solitaria]
MSNNITPVAESENSKAPALTHPSVDLPVVCVVGLGYIGLPTAAVLADHGMRVHGVEVSEKARQIINSGRAHVIEPDLDAVVKTGIDSGRLEAFDSPGPADVYMLCVPTPVGKESGADLSYIRSATTAICPHLQAGNLVILESTSPPGTTELIAEIVQAETGLSSEQVHFAHAPERVLPGHILREVIHNDRVIGGINEASTEAAAKFYSLFVQGELLKCHSRVAETVKLVENASRDSQIAFANELSMLCDAMDTDVHKVIELANHHPRVNILQPGCGVGGHCIAVDPWFLVHKAEQELGMNLPMIRTAREVNLSKTQWVVRRIIEEAAKFENPVVACMGAAYKPDVDDLRESPALEIAAMLRDASAMKVLLVEPHSSEIEGHCLSSVNAAVESANIFAFLVNHSCFRDIDAKQLAGSRVLDFCNFLSD